MENNGSFFHYSSIIGYMGESVYNFDYSLQNIKKSILLLDSKLKRIVVASSQFYKK
jgi:hypothetical protein